MKFALKEFSSFNGTTKMKSSEKSCSRLLTKRDLSSTKKMNLNRFKKGSTTLSSSSGKKQKSIGDFFSGRLVDKKHPTVKTPNAGLKSSRKCLFERSHHQKAPTTSIDETSSSSFTYSSNSQKFIDVDISGHCSRLDITSQLEIVGLVDGQATNRSENEESEKENSPKLRQTAGRSNVASSTKTDCPGDLKTSTKLHQAVITELDYSRESLRENFSRPDGYYRYLEGDSDERQENVEYDLDDEDMCWLTIVNTTKDFQLASKLTEDSLEMCLDRLEKVSAQLQLDSIKSGSVEQKNKQEEINEEDIFCAICLDDECQNSNVILLCDLCNLAVHQECYGIPYVPEGQWLCSWCQHEKSAASTEQFVAPEKGCPSAVGKSGSVRGGRIANANKEEGECCLCPVKGGALKKTDDGRWAHVICALWIPEVGFGNIEFLEPITKLYEVPPARHKLTCSVCKKKDVGACIQCMKRNCYTAFHIKCAQQIGTYMKIEQGSNEVDADSPANIKKSFLCDVHKPKGAKPFTPMYDNDSSDDDSDTIGEGNETPGVKNKKLKPKKSSSVKTPGSVVGTPLCRSTGKKGKGKGKWNKDGVVVASKSKSCKSAKATGSTICQTTVIPEIPVIPTKSLLEIETECFGSSSSGRLIGPIYSYWILKRKARNNMPLLKAYYTSLMSNNMPEKIGGTDNAKAALEGLKDAKKLRNEMEKVRLLLELVRKREKVKLLAIKAHEQEVGMRLNPWNYNLTKVLESLQSLDKCDIFAQPVSVDQVPGYYQKIREPMDFSTMQEKVATHSFDSFDSFVKDFNLMVDNCLTFNSKHTIFHKAASKIKKQAVPILEEARVKLSGLTSEPVTPLLKSDVDLNETELLDDKGCDKSIHDGVTASMKRQEDDADTADDEIKPDDDDDGQLEETVCYQNTSTSETLRTGYYTPVKSDKKDSSNDHLDEGDAALTSAVSGWADGDDGDIKLKKRNSKNENKVNIDPDDDDDDNDEDGFESSNINTTELYFSEEVVVTETAKDRVEFYLPRGDDGDDCDADDDVIIETISINTDESCDGCGKKDGDETGAPDGTASLASLGVPGDEDDEGQSVSLFGGPSGVAGSDERSCELGVTFQKKDVVKFLLNLARVVETSTERMVKANLKMEALVDNECNGGGKVVMTISDTLISASTQVGKASSPGSDSSTSCRQKRAASLRSKGNKVKSQTSFFPVFTTRSKPEEPRVGNKTVGASRRSPLKLSNREAAVSFKKPDDDQSEMGGLFSSGVGSVSPTLNPSSSLADTAVVSSASTIEMRRTSDRMKTATHRYLIDDDNIFSALLTPSKKKRRNSAIAIENLTGEMSKNLVEEEPPVLSRCPSPIEEEEVQSTVSVVPLTFSSSAESSQPTGSAVVVELEEDDDDDDFNSSSVTVRRAPLDASPDRKFNPANSSTAKKRVQQGRKKLKSESETYDPPHLVRSVSAIRRSTKRPGKVGGRVRSGVVGLNSVSRATSRRFVSKTDSEKQHQPKAVTAIQNSFRSESLNDSRPIHETLGSMPDLEKSMSGGAGDSRRSSMSENPEMPMLDLNDDGGSNFPMACIAGDDKAVSQCEDALPTVGGSNVVEKECCNTVENTPSTELKETVVDSEIVENVVTDSKKRADVKCSVTVKRPADFDAEELTRAQKKARLDPEPNGLVPESSTAHVGHSSSSDVPKNEEDAKNVSRTSSAETLAAAKLLLDLTRSPDNVDVLPDCQPKVKNIFDEFSRLRGSSSTPPLAKESLDSGVDPVAESMLSSSSVTSPPTAAPVSKVVKSCSATSESVEDTKLSSCLFVESAFTAYGDSLFPTFTSTSSSSSSISAESSSSSSSALQKSSGNLSSSVGLQPLSKKGEAFSPQSPQKANDPLSPSGRSGASGVVPKNSPTLLKIAQVVVSKITVPFPSDSDSAYSSSSSPNDQTNSRCEGVVS